MSDGPDGREAGQPKLFQPLAIRGLTLKNRLDRLALLSRRSKPRAFLRKAKRIS